MKVEQSVKERFKNIAAKATLMTATFGGYEITSPDGLRTEFQGQGALTNIVQAIFFFIIPIVGIVGFLFFLWTGFEMLMSKGDPKALAAAKARLTYTIVGLIIVFMAYIITLIVADLFNIATDI